MHRALEASERMHAPHLLDVEVAHAGKARLARCAELDHRSHGVLDRVLAAPPVQEVEVDVIGAEALERALAGGECALVGRVRGKDLGGDEDAVALARHGFGDDLLGLAVGVHLGRVDVGQAELDAEPERRDLVLLEAPVLTHVPGALADDADRNAGGSERACKHPGSLHLPSNLEQ